MVMMRREPEGETGLQPGEPAESLSVSPHYIQETTKSIALLQDMVRGLLRRGRDYGRTPGTASDGLWDPGASLIISGFNCYAGERRVLKLVDEADRMTVIIEVPLISRQTGREVGSGVGAASVLETKYKYRWLYPSELKEMGYTEEQINSLKTDKKKRPGKCRIENPERGELINTLVKQASKRAEVDAAAALPGVASALRELFGNEEEGARWDHFWGEVNRLGLTQDEARAILKVKSIKDWEDRGHSLDQALSILRNFPKAGSTPPENNAPQPKPTKGNLKRDPDTIKTVNELLRACNDDFKMQPKEVYKELNVSGPGNIVETPKDCYIKIAAVKEGPPS